MTMRRYIFSALAVVCFALIPIRALSQYYDWGQEPASVKWKEVRGDNGKIVFPDYYEKQALRLMNYMDTLRGQVGYGFRHLPMKMPLILHTQNFSPNGIVMIAPSRMEFVLIPPASTFAMPWHKQLAVHEFRHAVHYSNTNRNFVRVLSRILGQQGGFIGMGQMPYWMIEGDAVLTETEFSTFGRGVQPSFTIDYRAIVAEGINYRTDKFFSGSYKHHLPDHYTLGYHITRYSYDKYGENIWDKVSWFNSRNPYMIFPTPRALRKFYGTSSTKLFEETFERFAEYWGSVPEQENTASIIPTRTTSFTTYQTPVAREDGLIYALKTDLDRYTRLVSVDPQNGEEKKLAALGQINTGLVLIGDRLWWTEYRQSTFWEQRVNSQLCYYDIPTGRKGVARGKRHTVFPTASREGDGPAFVEYDYEGYYTVVTPSVEYVMPDTLSVHGLSYDRTTDKYYIIGLSDAGMWIGSVDELSIYGAFAHETTVGSEAVSSLRSIREYNTTGASIVHGPSYTTLSDLRAEDGKLYYTSIATGRDEAHMFDLATGRDIALTASRYGSFSPAPVPGTGEMAVTTYTSGGYMLALQSAADSPQEEIPASLVPRSVFNPPGLKWDVMNIDTLTLGSDAKGRKVGRYRKGPRQFRFHSWAPFWFDPESFMDEDRLNVYLGVTLLSQNLLNSATSTFGYRYTEAGSLFTAGLKFYGWAPKFEIDAEYGTMGQHYISLGSNYPVPNRDNHYAVTGRVYLPLLLGSGSRIKWLTPSFEVQHQNSTYYKVDKMARAYISDGLQKFRVSLSYTDNARLAHRDFLPRFGYAVRISNTFTPLNDHFGSIQSAFVRLFLPGILPHNSIMVRGAAQRQNLGLYKFQQKDIYPRGADFRYSPDRYGAFAVDYQLPLGYPDWGIKSVFYIRRIRANVYFDYARFGLPDATWDVRDKKATVHGRDWKGVNSYGLELTFDMVPFRLPPNTNTAFTISIYKPSDHTYPVVSAGLVLPL